MTKIFKVDILSRFDLSLRVETPILTNAGKWTETIDKWAKIDKSYQNFFSQV